MDLRVTAVIRARGGEKPHEKAVFATPNFEDLCKQRVRWSSEEEVERSGVK